MAELIQIEERLAIVEAGRGGVQIQLGLTPPVGNWVERHLSWDNPFITAPLPYENLTGIWDSAAPMNGEELMYWAHVEPGQLNGGLDDYSDKYLRNPVIWGPQIRYLVGNPAESVHYADYMRDFNQIFGVAG